MRNIASVTAYVGRDDSEWDITFTTKEGENHYVRFDGNVSELITFLRDVVGFDVTTIIHGRKNA